MNAPHRSMHSEGQGVGAQVHDITILSSVYEAMAVHGVAPVAPSELKADGCLHRHTVEGDKPNSQNGWHRIYTEVAHFGSWRTGVSETWFERKHTTLSRAERRQRHQRMEADRRTREITLQARHEKAAARAGRIWGDRRPTVSHGYLTRKGLQPHNVAQYGTELVLPVIDLDHRLHSLQFIDPDGRKRLLSGGRKKGCFIPVAGEMPGASRVLICEGWATGCSLAEMEPKARVLAAIDAGNLKEVAVTVRRAWARVELVICADADRVGMEKGRAAAIAAGGLLAVPEFPDGVSGSDWNDYATLMKGGDA